MDQDKIKRMFGSKRSLSLSDTQDSVSLQHEIVIPASEDYQRGAISGDKKQDQQFYSEKELTPVRGSWNFKKNTPVLEASLTDYVTQERNHSDQQGQGFGTPASLPNKTSMSLDDLKSQTGVYHDYALSSHFDYSPAVETPKSPQYRENFTGEEVPYNMSYLPEETQAIPGTKRYAAFSGLAGKVMTIFFVILALPFLALAGLYAVQGPEGEQWVAAKGQVQKLVRYAQGDGITLFTGNPSQKTDRQKTLASYKGSNQAKLSSQKNFPQKRRFGIGGTVISRSIKHTDIPLMIKVPRDGVSMQQLVKISGLPGNTSLTKGHYMASGVWMVAVKDIDSLALRINGTLKRDVELRVSYLKQGGQVVELASYKIPSDFQNHYTQTSNAPQVVAQDSIREGGTRHMNLASRHSTLDIPEINPSQPKGPKNNSLQAKTQNRTKSNPIRIHPVYEQQQLNRASIYLAKSDFDTARSILEKTALSGSARAATALARSYDPKFLLKIRVMGIKPDLDKAKHWYQQAVKLGNVSALKRLGQLK